MEQGQSIRLDLLVTKPLSKCEVDFARKTYQVFLNKKPPEHDYYVYSTFLGVPSSLPAGVYTAKYKISLGTKTKFERSVKVKVIEANFKTTHLSIPKKKRKLSKNRSQLSKEASIIGRKFKAVSIYRILDNRL